MRLAVLAAAAVLAITAARAQAPLTGTTSSVGSPVTPAPSGASAATGAQQVPSSVTPHRRRATLQERFDEANATHDGHLTQEQARARMPAVARDFAAIDADHKGYVTLDEIRAHTRTQRAARRAAQK